jgi:peptide/nickel transport system substrate-binding protein
MKGRIWASVAMTAIGASLLAAAMFAGTAAGAGAAAEAKTGGTLTIVSRSDFDYADTGLAYFSHSWNMMAATNLTLTYYPHVEGAAGGRLTGMAAPLPRVSNGGKTYTFTVKRGFKFNTGGNVTAANFKRAFDRGRNTAMQSPASSFMDDVASYRAAGQVFTVTLKKVAPDFLARMSMMFFAAVPADLPFTAEGVKAPVVSAGPYYLKEWNEGKSALAVRNPNWKNNAEPFKSLGFKNYVDQYRWIVGPDPATQRLMCERGEADICAFPPAQAKELSDKYGINKANGQFFVKNQTTLWYLAMNTSRGLFQNNVKLRQAVANAIDRRFMVAQHGYLAGKRTDQFLPYPMPGFKEYDLFSLKGPNYAKARPLAQGNTRDGKAVMYTFNTAQGPPIAQSVQFNLKQIGIDVEIKLFDRVVQHEKTATRGEPFDLTLEGWGMDYPDPSNFINVLLDGRRIQADNNVNASYFNNATYNTRMDKAYALAGQARLTAYGLLDRDIMKDQAPVAPYISTNARILTSTKVGCYGYTSIQSTLLTQLCTR